MDIAVICDVLGEENNGTTIAAMNLMWQKTASVLQSRSVLFWKRLWRGWMWCM